MSLLKDLQKKIYQKITLVNKRPEEHLSPPSLTPSDVGWIGRKERSFVLRNIWLFITALAIVVGGTALLFFGTSQFTEEEVYITIDVSPQVSGIERTEWKVTVTNANRINLNNVELIFEYPEDALPVEDIYLDGSVSRVQLGVIEAGEDISRFFQARLLGEEGDIKTAKATVRFMTEGLSRALERETKAQTKIVSLPLVLEATGPKELQPEAEGLWTFTLRNDSSLDLEQTRVRIEYPEGFSRVSATPVPHISPSTWDLGSFKIGQERVIRVGGVLEGKVNEQKTFSAFLELPIEEERHVVLARAIVTTKLVLSPLSLSISANEKDAFVAKPGDTVTVALTYRNHTTVEINALAAEVVILGDMLNVPSIESEGHIDVAAQTIRWDETTTPALARLRPGEAGSITFSFAVKNSFPIKSFTDKNFSLRLLGQIRSQNPPGFLTPEDTLQKEEFVIPISTIVSVQVSGEYRGGLFQNTGGTPPAVSKQTTYTIYWRVTNAANDVKDFEIVSTLPSWATFTGLKRANFAEAGLSYDSAGRRMIWNIDTLPSGTGIILPVYEAAFQIAIIPEAVHIGKTIEIIGSLEVKGIDTFTNEIISVLVPSIKTDLNGALRETQSRVTN